MGLIDANKLLDVVEEIDWYHLNNNREMVHGANSDDHQAWYKSDDIYEAIRNAPTVEATPIRHGKWIDEGQYNDSLPFHTWRCSACGGPISKTRVPWFKYCPHCGARMDDNETES